MCVSRTFVFLFIFGLFYNCESKYGYVVWSENKPVAKVSDYFADIPDVHVARATYTNEINNTGFVCFSYFEYLFFMKIVIELLSNHTFYLPCITHSDKTKVNLFGPQLGFSGATHVRRQQ